MTTKTRTPRIKGTASQHNQLGVSFYESGAIDLAIQEFRRATKRVPWVATYWLNLGAALLDKAEDKEAESALSRALRLNPNSQSVYYHLAQLHKKRGDQSATRAAYEKAIELGPHTYLADRAREYLEGWHPRIWIPRDPKKLDEEGE
jgi:tetratricopeptide (TPR) repeat protein